jgi:hypothetical protein
VLQLTAGWVVCCVCGITCLQLVWKCCHVVHMPACIFSQHTPVKGHTRPPAGQCHVGHSLKCSLPVRWSVRANVTLLRVPQSAYKPQCTSVMWGVIRARRSCCTEQDRLLSQGRVLLGLVAVGAGLSRLLVFSRTQERPLLVVHRFETDHSSVRAAGALSNYLKLEIFLFSTLQPSNSRSRLPRQLCHGSARCLARPAHAGRMHTQLNKLSKDSCSVHQWRSKAPGFSQQGMACAISGLQGSRASSRHS